MKLISGIFALLLFALPAHAQQSVWLYCGTSANNAKPCGISGQPMIVTTTGAPAGLTPLGYQQITSLGTAASLTVPAGATVALIEPNNSGTAIRWRDDGVAPTASVGIELQPGSAMVYAGSLAAFQAIQESATAILNISYYK